MATGSATEREIAGRYVLLSQMGEGGMGIVWRARDSLLGREVALKEIKLPPGLNAAEQESFQQRVLREARVAAQLTHPGAVTVFDVIREHEQTYIAMELLDAPTLSDLVQANGPLRPERVAEIGSQIADALATAHARGIVHRDVKPSNVMVPDSGHVKLADFGIASVKGDPKITTSGTILGSPGYMAPEQAQALDTGPPTDAWGLGATLYFALEGKSPFEKGQAIATLNAVVHEAPTRPARDAELGEIVMRLLDKDPATRLRVEETYLRLGEMVRRRPVPTAQAETAVPTAAYTAAPAVPAPAPAAAEAVAHEPPARRSPWPVLLGVAALGLAALLVWSLTSGSDETRPQREQRRERAAAPGTSEETQAEESATTTTVAPAEEITPADVEGWILYDGLPTGYGIDYPSDWVTDVGDSTTVDLQDPAGGRYLRVDWTDTPGDDPVAYVEESGEPNFRSRYPDYRRVRLEPYEFHGFEAVWWEYTYSSGGAPLHAVNLQFVTGDYGFALNFNTRESLWEESQAIFEQFQDSFTP